MVADSVGECGGGGSISQAGRGRGGVGMSIVGRKGNGCVRGCPLVRAMARAIGVAECAVRGGVRRVGKQARVAK